LFIRHADKGRSLVHIYVDDMIITGDDVGGIHELKSFLNQHFEMKVLGDLSYFLALEIPSNSGGYCLTQAKYATDLLSRAGLSNSKIADTPFKANFKLALIAGVPLKDPMLYHQLFRSLIYQTVT